MVGKYSAAVAANRFGLGARPGEIGAMADDPRGALRAQLLGGAPLIHNVALPDTATVLSRAAELRVERRDNRRAQAKDSNSPTDAGSNNAVVPEAAQKLQAMFRGVYIDDASARMRQAVSTDRPFVERLVHFWTNHFAVSVDKGVVLGVAGAFEREAIRPHVLGSFHEMLLAVEQHPAMLLYLDNFQSVGPNSKAARARERQPNSGTAPRAKVGINENLAREILELHTLGVGSGYTQTDVTEFAKVITGWSIGGGQGRQRAGSPGVFYYREGVHEPGTRTLLGNSYSDDGFSQGVAVLRDLARAPATAHHIATKLARHFIADDPPAAAVDRLAEAFSSTGGNLPSVYQALIESPEAWAQPLAKFKTPADYIHSSYRALELPIADGPKAIGPFELMGQRIYSPGSPAGWPDRSVDWDGSSSVMKRLEWADQVGQRVGSQINAADRVSQALGSEASEHTRTSIARAESGAQAVTLLLACPEFMRR
jgi:uncharacterized protein (DUF1800 family)